MKKQYAALFQIFYVYWRIYGGWKALIFSPYFHAAIIVSAICYPLWWKGKWASITLGTVPSLLGFSIGAFAILLSFGHDAMALLKDEVEVKSKYLGVVVSFVHFIVIQSTAVILSLIGKVWTGWLIGAIGTSLTAYAIMLALAACMRLFRLARVYNQIKDKPEPINED